MAYPTPSRSRDEGEGHERKGEEERQSARDGENGGMASGEQSINGSQPRDIWWSRTNRITRLLLVFCVSRLPRIGASWAAPRVLRIAPYYQRTARCFLLLRCILPAPRLRHSLLLRCLHAQSARITAVLFKRRLGLPSAL